jgi:type VI secretion system protein ImpA
LTEFLAANCRPESSDEPTHPDTREFREELQSIRTVMRQLLGTLEDSNESGGADLQPEAAGTEVVSDSPKNSMNRESALRTIEQLASFFERTEPHSPLHFALRQVVRWGRMPFDKLLIELIDDRSVIENLRRQIGLPAGEDDDR